MFQSVVDYFIDPILAALYASLFTWFLTALGASFVLCLKHESSCS
jgi:ZIP family zinc transporter